MLSLTRFAALCAVLAAMAAIPAVASAGTVPMRGVVSGSPYGASNGQMAVPVLFSKMTARNTGLRSPVGVIILKRTQKVKLPNGGGYTLPVNLRNGDRFKGFGVVSSLQRRVFYPRIVFSKPVVYFRSKELSIGELSAAVDALRKALANLQSAFDAFKSQSAAAFNALLQQLADLRNALNSLKIPTGGVDLTGIQSQIDALSKQLNDLIASLPDFSQFALLSDLSSYVKLSDLSGLIASDPTVTALQSALTTAQGQISTLQGDVSTLQGQVTTLTSRLNSLCSALKTVPAVSAVLSSSNCP